MGYVVNWQTVMTGKSKVSASWQITVMPDQSIGQPRPLLRSSFEQLTLMATSLEVERALLCLGLLISRCDIDVDDQGNA